MAGHNSLLSDIAYQLYPWFEFVGRALRQGHFPQWRWPWPWPDAVSVVAIGAWFAWQSTDVTAPHKLFTGRAAEAVAFVIVVVIVGWMARRRPAVAVVLLATCAVSKWVSTPRVGSRA